LNRTLDFLAGGGSTGALMRANDWSESPLGPPEIWPQPLRTVVGLLLQSQFPMFAGMFCAVWETTRKVLAERALRELNETLERRVTEALAERNLLADIVEGTNAFVQVADLEYRWLAVNKAAADEFERIFGKRPAVGASMLDLLASQPEHQAAVRAVWSRAFAGEEFTEIGEFGDPGRNRRAYEMRYNTLRDRDGHRIGAYQFVYDVTERLRDHQRLRDAEEALRHAQKMESLGQLTGGVAHDFNNLLAVFLNGLELLERRVSGEQRQIVLEGMRRAVARGTGLTHHLLAFSRRRPVNPESINLAAHLTSMHEILGRSLGGNIHIEMKLGADLWPVEIDVGELELAMLNVCVNSRDAMPGGGAISITAENVQEAGGDGLQTDFVKISIADTGSGMPPEVSARVFEPFFTTKDIGKGSGLGLPQVYGFAQQSGGRLTVHSEVGKGTIVTLLLPRSLRQPAAPKVVDASSACAIQGDVARRRQVLLVEDDSEVAALTREMLSYLGFSVVHAASPDAALGALANARSVDIVLSDIMMPGGVSGLELAREIRRRRPNLPVVLVTGYAEAAASMEDGKFGLLLKPYTVEALAEALSAELN
jgi:signal transduction histidine kinase